MCQWLASRWFSPGIPISSTNQTDRHDISDVLLKVVLNTINNQRGRHTIQRPTGIMHNDKQRSTQHCTEILIMVFVTQSRFLWRIIVASGIKNVIHVVFWNSSSKIYSILKSRKCIWCLSQIIHIFIYL